MGRTSFYLTSKELENHYANIEQTWTCSSIDDETRSPNFWLQTNEHRTVNLIRPSLDLAIYSSKWLEHHFFEHQADLNVFIFWQSNSNTLFLASNDRTTNIVRPITKKVWNFHTVPFFQMIFFSNSRLVLMQAIRRNPVWTHLIQIAQALPQIRRIER